MLNLLSFTGADDNTDIVDLVEFVKRYPNTEMALLYFPEKEGTARNPSSEKREEIRNELYNHTQGMVAAHLCGEEVFRKILSEDSSVLRDLRRYDRVQVNINARKKLFSDDEVRQVYKTLWQAQVRLILQYHDDSRELVENFVYDPQVVQNNQPYVLFDSSKGTGVALETIPRPLPWIRCGFAGGINPQNARTIYDNIMKVYAGFERPRTFWMDMESGVRTDNEFDLDLCQQVADAVTFY